MDQNSMAKDLLLYRGASSLDSYNSPVLAIIDRTSLRYRRLQRPCHGLVEADCRCYHRCPIVSTVIFLERVGSRATRTVLDFVSEKPVLLLSRYRVKVERAQSLPGYCLLAWPLTICMRRGLLP